MNDRITITRKKKVGDKFVTVYRPAGPSELTDSYLITSLRSMEARMPESGELEIGYVEDLNDIEDQNGFRNYEVFKIEAETRGLTWRMI